MRLAPTLREHSASSYPASDSAKEFKAAGKHETNANSKMDLGRPFLE